MPVSTSGAAGYSVFYGYDVRGLQTFARFGSITGTGITNQYDGFGRLRSSSTNMDGTSRTVTSDYDLHGNRVRVTHPDGAFFEYAYEHGGQPDVHLGEWALHRVGLEPLRRVRSSLADQSRHGRDHHGLFTFDEISRLKGDRPQPGRQRRPPTTRHRVLVQPGQPGGRPRPDQRHLRLPRSRRQPDVHANGLNQYTQIAGTAGAPSAGTRTAT